MRHVPDGVLRRLEDEPLAVPDRATDHVAGCPRCRARRALIADDAGRAGRLLSTPQLVPGTDMAWARFQRELHRSSEEGAERRQRPAPDFRPSSRFPVISLRAGLALGAVGIVVASTAAAATLTSVFAPTHVAPVSLSQTDLRSVATVLGLGNSPVLGGFPTPSGSRPFRFGTIKWSSAGVAQPATSLAGATAQAGFRVPLPSHLPAGVGAVQQFMVQPQVSATLTFSSTAQGVGGSSVTIHGGPAVVAQYGGAGGIDLPTLTVVTMPRPTALSTGATLGQVEAFLLRQPGVPPELAEEVRLLGDLGTTLPVPVPQGASVRSVQVAGWPGVLLADSSNVAAAVVWEDGRSMVHVVAGILDSQDVLNVANQLG